MPSANVLEQKKVVVANLTERLNSSIAGVIVDYKGINVADDTALRKELREAGVEYTVVKNTLVRFAANEIGFEALGEHLNGTTALAISAEDPIAPARILCKYAKTSKTFKVKVGVLEGKVVPESEINAIAELPNKETLVATVLYGFNTPITKLCIALNEIKNKMEAGEAAPVAAEAAAE